MKTEIAHIPGKGICIVISDINVEDFINGTNNIPSIKISGGPFSNIHTIANHIRTGKKVCAVKEIRGQTNWGLREAKQYIDRFMANSYWGGNDIFTDRDKEADEFIRYHTTEDFINKDEFKI